MDSFFPGRRFTAYLFDFDGTIADTMPAHLIAWNKALDVYGLTLSQDQHQAWAGRPTREIVRILSELHGTELSYEAISAAKETHYLGSLGDVRGIGPVVDIIRAARGKIPMAVVSGSRHKPVDTTLRHLGLEGFFGAVVCAEDYVKGKPEPDCFLKAAARLGVNPGDCLAFEDAELGIRAAHAAGMACVRVTGTAEHGHSLSPVPRR